MQEMWAQSLDPEDPMEKEWQPSPVSLFGKSHGQRSLVGHSPRVHRRVRHALVTQQPQHFVL